MFLLHHNLGLPSSGHGDLVTCWTFKLGAAAIGKTLLREGEGLEAEVQADKNVLTGARMGRMARKRGEIRAMMPAAA